MCGLVRICEHQYGFAAECLHIHKFTKFAIDGRSKPKLLCVDFDCPNGSLRWYLAMQVAIMRSNALNLVSAFLLFPTALALLFAWKAKEPVDYDLAFVVWLWFGLPGLMLATFLFWLGRPNRLQQDADQASSRG
jgi:hypothetical protein